MKIDVTSKVGGSGELPQKKTEKTGSTQFDSVLKEAMAEKGVKADAPLATPRIPSVTATPKASNSINLLAVGQLESLLDDLTIYKNSLENQDVPVGRIKPMVDSLKERKNDLVSLLKVVDDPELKMLVSQAAALVVDENSRFHSSSSN